MAKPANAPRGWQELRSFGWLLYNRARDDIAAIYKGGWRPLLGFMGVYVAHFAFVYAPKHGISIDYPSTLTFLGFVGLQAVARGAEKHMSARIPAAG